jgi:2-polyprenyl-3-methyl-5-hydroxy-6-metoxy-1,4-benzoquinol methylase
MERIRYLSEPAEVRMADRWFEIASIEHFWIRRRFEVLRKIAGGLIETAESIAEIGCGNGLLQTQIEQAYKRPVDGFDLNAIALKQNVSQISPVYCYDILEKRQEFRQKYDLIFLFDVLEHIPQEREFLAAVKFHLAPKGTLVVNVPAGQWAYSKYDQAAGHVRRYSGKTLRAAAQTAGFDVSRWTYWGLPMIPALMLRKFWLRNMEQEREIISAGFDSRSKGIDSLMRILSNCEVLPQKFIGTSLMATLRIQGEAVPNQS